MTSKSPETWAIVDPIPQPEASAPRRSLISVRGALQLPALRAGAPEVLAARRHLDRTIRWVHVAEVPNIAGLLKGGELLLSTGVGIGRGAVAQRRYIDELAARDVAALVVELGHHFRELPGTLVSHAERRGMPLIALRREIPFIEVTEAIHSNIVGRQLAALRRGEEIHRRFTELMLDGAGIPEVMSALAHTIANPVLLDKANVGVLYHATHRTPAVDVLAAWKSLREVDAPQSTGLPQSLTLPKSEAPERAAGGDAIAVEIPATGGGIWGHLVALPLDSPLDEFARVAVERAVALVALTVLRTRQEEMLSARERGNFLADIAAGQLRPSDAAQRAEALGFHQRVRAFLLPIAVAMPEPERETGERTSETAWAPVWEALRNELHSRSIPVLVGTRTRKRDALVLVGLATLERRTEVVDAVADAVHSAARRHGLDVSPPVLAAGAVVASWAELTPALTETADTAAIARSAPPRRWHDAATPDVDRLLAQLKDDPDLRRFVTNRLQPLVQHDRRRSSALLATLEMLLEREGRKAETARALHLERQSLYHRIQRIEALLGADLGDPGTRLGLHLALRARRQIDGLN